MEAFNGLLGAGGANLEICYRKFMSMKKTTESIAKVVKSILKHPYLTKCDEMKAPIADLSKFSAELDIFIATQFDDIFANYLVPECGTEEEKKKFTAQYEAIKTATIITNLILTCKNLKPDFGRENVNQVFIQNLSGNTYEPLSFVQWNIKEIFTSPAPKEVKDYIFVWLKLIYKDTYELYQHLTSPDIDVDKVTEVIAGSIDDLKKAIPRCDKAFQIIKNSTSMFKKNFGKYYKDFLIAQNPSIMLENFVIDISTTAHGDPELIRQFKKIINHYKKMAGPKLNDPKLAKLFQSATSQFDSLASI
ncbi:MAG: hypothetical protein KAS12_03970 [Candidatus Aenigmarchaeota archaeon]|nr:hypothetical protein [Candidatus Aenigmarchaeota archaeon]